MNYFIGDKEIQHSKLFFILNCAFWKQVAIEHEHNTNAIISWGGDSGISVNVRQSHEIKPSQAFYQ